MISSADYPFITNSERLEQNETEGFYFVSEQFEIFSVYFCDCFKDFQFSIPVQFHFVSETIGSNLSVSVLNNSQRISVFCLFQFRFGDTSETIGSNLSEKSQKTEKK